MLWKLKLLDCAKTTGSSAYGVEGSPGQPAPIARDYPHCNVLALERRRFSSDLTIHPEEWGCLGHEYGRLTVAGACSEQISSAIVSGWSINSDDDGIEDVSVDHVAEIARKTQHRRLFLTYFGTDRQSAKKLGSYY